MNLDTHFLPSPVDLRCSRGNMDALCDSNFPAFGYVGFSVTCGPEYHQI